MGVAIVHHSPLWAQSDGKIKDAFTYTTTLDSVWDLVLYIGDRMEFVKKKALNQFSTEMILMNPMSNPCLWSGGTFTGFTVSLSLLVQGYPYYNANNKEKQETDQTEEIEVVQMWLWFEMGQACCKIKVPDDDDWFSSMMSIASPYGLTMTSLYDFESLLAGEDPYLPTKKYPLGTWDVFDLTQFYLAGLSAGMGCGGGLFGGGGLFESEYEYKKIQTARIKWQWDYYKIKTADFETEDQADQAYKDAQAESGGW